MRNPTVLAILYIFCIDHVYSWSSNKKCQGSLGQNWGTLGWSNSPQNRCKAACRAYTISDPAKFMCCQYNPGTTDCKVYESSTSGWFRSNEWNHKAEYVTSSVVVAVAPGTTVELAKTTYLLTDHGGYAYIDEMPSSDAVMGFAPEYESVQLANFPEILEYYVSGIFLYDNVDEQRLEKCHSSGSPCEYDDFGMASLGLQYASIDPKLLFLPL